MPLRSLALVALLATTPLWAAAVSVPYTGLYDETVSAPNGDYDAIGGLIDVGEFTLIAGDNVFLGGIRTPSDSSDAFLVSIPVGFTLVAARIDWGTNATMFNPIFARPGPIWTLEESDADPTIFLVPLGGNGSDIPLVYSPAFAPRGAGSYSMTIGNGVFAMNNNDPIRYRMTFKVNGPTPPTPTPEPATLGLLGLGLAALGARRRRR
jgi:hypothetical protein